MLANFLQDANRSVEAKIDEISDCIGKNPVLLEEDLDTPDLWGSLSEVASLIKDHASSYKKESYLVKTALAKEVKVLVEEVELKCEHKSVLNARGRKQKLVN